MRAARARESKSRSMPAPRHSDGTTATGWTGYPGSRRSAKRESREAQERRRDAVIMLLSSERSELTWVDGWRDAVAVLGTIARTARCARGNERPHADPLGLPEARPRRRDLRPLHREPAVLPEPAGRHHAGTSARRHGRLRIDLRSPVRQRFVGLARAARAA